MNQLKNTFKNTFDRWKNKTYRFMYGRYGGDTLNKVYLWVYLGVAIAYAVSLFFISDDAFKTRAILWACYMVTSIALLVLVFFRMFSRNIAKRRRENEKFCGFFKLWRNRVRDRKTHVYRKCPKCRAVLRLPRAKGKHNVVCPRCRERFRVRG